MARAVISSIGHDKPGLIATLTQIAKDSNLNIEDSRMTAMGGEFAVIMSVSGEQANLVQFENALTHLANDEFAFIFREARDKEVSTQTIPYVAEVVAIDHPGIVASIANFFSGRDINIRDLNTTATPAPHTGTPIFTVTLTAEVPTNLRNHELKSAFEDFCVENDLDGELERLR